MKLLVNCPCYELGMREPRIKQAVINYRCSVDRFIELACRLHPDSDVPYLTFSDFSYSNGMHLSSYHLKILKLRFWIHYVNCKFYLL